MPVYKIAGLHWKIEPRTDFTRKLLQDYRVLSEQVDTVITPCPGEPEHEGLLRRISMELTRDYAGAYIHGAALLYQGQVYLFTAPSGTGKSTHVTLWKQLLGEQVTILNGDKPFLRCIDGQILVYGGPWRGKEGWGVDACGPLAGIFVMKRGQENRVTPMSDLDALNALLSATLYPEDHEGLEKLLDLLGKVLSRVPVCALSCNTHISAAETVLRYIERECS